MPPFKTLLGTFLAHFLWHIFYGTFLAHFLWHIFMAHFWQCFIELHGPNHLFAFLHYCILTLLPHSIFAFSSCFRSLAFCIFAFFSSFSIFSGIVYLYLDVAFSALLYHNIVVSSSLACFIHILGSL